MAFGGLLLCPRVMFHLVKANSSPSLKWVWYPCQFGTTSCFLRLEMISLFVIMWTPSCLLTGKLWVIWGDEGNDLPVTFYCPLKKKNGIILTWCRHEEGAVSWRLWQNRSPNTTADHYALRFDWVSISIVLTMAFLCLWTVTGSCVILRHLNLQCHMFFS